MCIRDSYRALKRYDDALRDYSKAIELDSNNAANYANRGVIYAYLDEIDNALIDLTKAIELDSNDASFYLVRAVLFEFEYPEEFVIDMVKSISLSPCEDDLEIWWLDFLDDDEPANAFRFFHEEICR